MNLKFVLELAQGACALIYNLKLLNFKKETPESRRFTLKKIVI